jgi:hypothetical protein
MSFLGAPAGVLSVAFPFMVCRYAWSSFTPTNAHATFYASMYTSVHTYWILAIKLGIINMIPSIWYYLSYHYFLLVPLVKGTHTLSLPTVLGNDWRQCSEQRSPRAATSGHNYKTP